MIDSMEIFTRLFRFHVTQNSSVIEIHRKSIQALNSEADFGKWKTRLDLLPKRFKDNILKDLEQNMRNIPLTNMDTLPYDWTDRYICLLIFKVTWDLKDTPQFNEFLKMIPPHFQIVALQSIENYFFPFGHLEHDPNSSWIERFTRLINNEVKNM